MGRRKPPAPSAQRKEKCLLANLEKESCLYEDTVIILQNKWDCSRYRWRWSAYWGRVTQLTGVFMFDQPTAQLQL